MFTRLGENVKDLAEADAVARHYLDGIDRIRALNLDCEPSIKLTQLGLDIDRELAYGAPARPRGDARTPPATICGSTWSSRRMSTSR